MSGNSEIKMKYSTKKIPEHKLKLNDTTYMQVRKTMHLSSLRNLPLLRNKTNMYRINKMKLCITWAVHYNRRTNTEDVKS